MELNEAFTAQDLACLPELGLPYDAPHVNPEDGRHRARHPLGLTGARLVFMASQEEQRYARQTLATMCIRVGQRISLC
ncbi:hypothetical protein [Rhizobium oryzihabitans]|uniref:hypothetical protein n=1 Tax=Rhizobium oryzihabitans TaxID=2267833 RepID=UPI0040366A90